MTNEVLFKKISKRFDSLDTSTNLISETVSDTYDKLGEIIIKINKI